MANRLEQALESAMVWIARRDGRHSTAVWLCKSAQRAMAERRFKSTIRFARCAIAADSRCVASYRMLSYAYMMLGQLVQAKETAEQAIRVGLDDAGLLADLGDAEYALGNYPAAAAAYQTSLRSNPRDNHVLQCLAAALQGQEKWPEALAAYEHVLVLKPMDVTTLAATGEMYAKMGDYQTAASILSDAIGRAPDLPGAHFYLAVSLANLNRLVEARRHAARALELKPSSREFRQVLAEIEDKLADQGKHSSSGG